MQINEQAINRWIQEVEQKGLLSPEGIRTEQTEGNRDLIWPASVREKDGLLLCLIKLITPADGPRAAGPQDVEMNRALLIEGSAAGGPAAGGGGPAERTGFSGTAVVRGNRELLFCPLSHANADALRKVLPFTAPSRMLEKKTTIGLGDRLGIATPGHIREIRGHEVFPVFAQQSVRELELTGRSYADIVDAATWAVFQEGYEKPWGADGDHLKSADWLKKSLSEGCTMVTVDVSEHIRSEFEDSEADLDAGYELIDRNYCSEKERRYLGNSFSLDTGEVITFTQVMLKRIILVYKEAVDFAVKLFKACREAAADFDFEVSLDETDYPTLPEAHLFVATELRERGVRFQTVAPRFVGEFQKGIDYIGKIGQFKENFAVHAAIARLCGHKLSIHSGSDKFTVFPIIGGVCGGRFHLKTSGTHWLEALHLALEREPGLFRSIFDYAIKVFPTTRTYYHITPDLGKIEDINSLPDNELSRILENVHSRQVLHVSYGEILKNPDLRNRLMEMLGDNEEEYYSVLGAHLEKHLQRLLPRGNNFQ